MSEQDRVRCGDVRDRIGILGSRHNGNIRRFSDHRRCYPFRFRFRKWCGLIAFQLQTRANIATYSIKRRRGDLDIALNDGWVVARRCLQCRWRFRVAPLLRDSQILLDFDPSGVGDSWLVPAIRQLDFKHSTFMEPSAML